MRIEPKLWIFYQCKIFECLFFYLDLKVIYLFFAVPPKSVTLGKPEPVRAGESLQLACTAKDSNPKTTLTWYRDDNPLPDGAGKNFKLRD